MRKGKRPGTRRKDGLSRVFALLIVVSIVGFLGVLGLFVHERITFGQSLPRFLTGQSVEDMNLLLDAYNKANTGNMLALFYTVITTIIFGYGLTLFRDMTAQAKTAREEFDTFVLEKDSVLRAIFFSKFISRISPSYMLTVELQICPDEAQSRIITLVKQQLEDSATLFFPIQSIVGQNKISSDHKSLLNEMFTGIETSLSGLQKRSHGTPDAVLDEAERFDAESIRDCVDICEKYRNALKQLSDEGRPKRNSPRRFGG